MIKENNKEQPMEDGNAISTELQDVFRKAFNKVSRRRACGTGVVNQLNKAREDFNKGLPLSENVIVDEVEMIVFDEWTKIGQKHTRTEYGDVVEDIITPRIEIVGEDRDVQLLSPDEIHGFLPQHGHEYRLLVRRFQVKSSNFDNAQYELIRVIIDTLKIGM